MFQIRIRNENEQREFEHRGSVLEFGRGPRREAERCVIQDRYVSRDQLRIETLGPGRVKLQNLGALLVLGDGSALETGATRDVPLPVQIAAGYTTIEISGDEEVAVAFQTIAPPRSMKDPPSNLASISSLGLAPSAATLANWFETLLTVQQAATGSGEFYQETARAVVELVGLDRGLVLLRQGDDWSVAAIHTTDHAQGVGFSRGVLRQVVEQRRSFFEAGDDLAPSPSLVGVEAVVASPIRDAKDEVIGAVYGSRNLRSPTGQRGIAALEAQVVQLLAGMVSAALARLAREAEASRVRVQFEQFFSPELVRELERNPQLLEGHQREITVLFCDLRGFSRIAERLGPRQTYALAADFLDHVTNSILAHAGAVIDYAGDGMAAMWNAPTDQPDHAERACQAGLEMLRQMTVLEGTWAKASGGGLRMGIGIHSGTALVGNTGSRRRLKYGPRGHTVNLASRVEGATKQFGVPLLITQATRAQLPEIFQTRRLGRVRMLGIDEPVELHELPRESRDAQWQSQRERYERALAHFESGRLQDCRCELNTADAAGLLTFDLPSQLLHRRVCEMLQDPTAGQNVIWNLDVK